MLGVRYIYDLVIYLLTGRVLPSLASPSIILSFLIIQSIQNLQIIPIILSVQRGGKFLILNYWCPVKSTGGAKDHRRG